MRSRPPADAGERETLTGFLDRCRAVVADKATGLDSQQLNLRLPPGELSIASILHHLAWVENYWFNQAFMDGEPGEPWASARRDDRDWEFHAAAELSPATVLDRYRTECERSRRIVDAAGSLDDMSRKPYHDGRAYSLRWILVHMIDETARHAGHADLIRESIDGARGDWVVAE